MDIDFLVKRAGKIAKDKGFNKIKSQDNSFKDFHRHIKSELKELKKAVKPWEPIDHTTTFYDPNSCEAEIADIIIRTASYCDLIGVDLNKAVMEKMFYNSKRLPGKEY